ncbi:unnamed protein product, partial [Didymodactylos carnosus]
DLEPVHLTDIIYTIGNVNLSTSEITLLTKGLKFIPNKPFHLTNKFRQCTMKMLSSSLLSNKVNVDEFMLSAFSNRKDFVSNLAKNEQMALYLLRHQDDIIIRPANKNVCIVVLESSIYESKVLQQLNDRNFL